MPHPSAHPARVHQRSGNAAHRARRPRPDGYRPDAKQEPNGQPSRPLRCTRAHLPGVVAKGYPRVRIDDHDRRRQDQARSRSGACGCARRKAADACSNSDARVGDGLAIRQARPDHSPHFGARGELAIIQVDDGCPHARSSRADDLGFVTNDLEGPAERPAASTSSGDRSFAARSAPPGETG